MKILLPPTHDKTRNDLPPAVLREYNTLKASVLDVERFPTLSKDWSGPLIIGDRLACHDDSPLARRFETLPGGTDAWRHVGDVADRVLADLAARMRDEAA